MAILVMQIKAKKTLVEIPNHQFNTGLETKVTNVFRVKTNSSIIQRYVCVCVLDINGRTNKA